MSNFEIFKNGWQSKTTHDSSCGWGSDDDHTLDLRLTLPYLIEAFHIKTICDAGCGDLQWVKQTDLKGTTYKGFDMFPHYEWQLAVDTYPAVRCNIAKEPVDPCDLIICRDVFIHWPNDIILETLELFKQRGKYLLSTSYVHAYDEVDNINRIKKCSLRHSKLLLQTEPFNLGVPIFIIPEDCHNYPDWSKLMGLWKL